MAVEANDLRSISIFDAAGGLRIEVPLLRQIAKELKREIIGDVLSLDVVRILQGEVNRRGRIAAGMRG